MDVGTRVSVPPIPPIEANTRLFDAGAVRFGVEYRLLNEAIVGAHMADNTAPRKPRESEIDDAGVSIHVFGSNGQEYLRFDCFREDPHYHYITPGADHQLIVGFDRAANGDPLDWTLGALRARLGPMLRVAGADAVADASDHDRVAQVLDEVERAARRAG